MKKEMEILIRQLKYDVQVIINFKLKNQSKTMKTISLSF